MSQASAETRPDPSVDVRLLILLRMLAVIGQTLAVAMADWVMGLSLPVGLMSCVIASLAIFNGMVWWQLRPSYHVAPGTATAHLTLDVLALAVLLYFSGGGTNPFVTVFLLPLIIAATILPERWTWTLTGVTVACYSLVLLWYEPVDWPSAWRAFELHVLGMWLAFVLSAAVVGSFVVAMARRLRERERELERERERARRDSEVVALGSLAAQSVHELGNPLATIHLLALELEETAPAGSAESAYGEQLQTLRAEVDRCSQALARLSAGAGSLGVDSRGVVAVERWLGDLINGWWRDHPGIQLETRLPSGGTSPVIAQDEALDKALVSILDNAARVSPAAVVLEAYWDASQLSIIIRDRGPGPPRLLATGGAVEPESAQLQGMGIGLLLARSAIERLGGNLNFSVREGGGTNVTVRLPMAGLRPETRHAHGDSDAATTRG
jgi:two-component system sensor histidine kinase RegB